LADPRTNGIDTTYNQHVRNNNLMQHHYDFIVEQDSLRFIISETVAF
jgi:hypothetical protein